MIRSLPRCTRPGDEFYLTVDEQLRERLTPLADDFPVSVYTQHYRHTAMDRVPLHWHDELQLTWVFRGALDYSVEGHPLCLADDRLVVVNRGRLHGSQTVGGDAAALCVNFSPEVFHPLLLRRYILPLLDDPAFSHAVLPLRPEWAAALRGLCAQERQPDCFAVSNFLAQVFEVLTRDGASAVGRRDDGGDAAVLQAALDEIHSNYAAPITVSRLAGCAAVNKNRLNELFKRYTGMTPAHYLNDYRLYAAKYLVICTDHSITDICAETGFRQLSHFIEQFRLRYGASPLRYRAAHQAEKED